MLTALLGTARDIGRLQDIASVFVRYGFGDAVQRLGMAGALERAGKILHWTQAAEFARLAPPERVRHALQDLGPTFDKLGQILATRVDLFAPELIEEFEKLQDRAPPAAFGEVRAQMFQDLGVAPEDVFVKFDSDPIAAGSIAQVHRAQLADGTQIAVKVRRPGIRPIVEADLRLALVLKVCVTLEATGRELDPDFDMAGEAAPFLRAAVLARRGPAALAKRSWRALAAALEIFADLPQDLRRILRSARSGRLQVHIDLTRLNRFGNQLDRAASRLALGVVTAALIIGSSIVMTIEGGPTLLGLPVFGLLGFLGAVAGGAWLLHSIWRSGRGG